MSIRGAAFYWALMVGTAAVLSAIFGGHNFTTSIAMAALWVALRGQRFGDLT